MEQHFKGMDQKVMQDNNLESFSAPFAQSFTTKPNSQKFHGIMSFTILSIINSIS